MIPLHHIGLNIYRERVRDDKIKFKKEEKHSLKIYLQRNFAEFELFNL